MSAPLRKLIRVGVPWVWDDQQQEAFALMKIAIITAPFLQFYYVKQELTLKCDASSHGLGAACLQDGKPVAHVSRALWESHKR